MIETELKAYIDEVLKRSFSVLIIAADVRQRQLNFLFCMIVELRRVQAAPITNNPLGKIHYLS